MADERLESWKEIAAYLKRDESTVRRWERSEGLPVHRHQHQARSSVYAFPAELDSWRDARRPPGPGTGSQSDRPSTAGTVAAALAVIVLSAGGGSSAGQVVSGAQNGGQLSAERVWSGSGVNTQGRISPDGRFLTFADWSDGPANLAVRDLQTGENRRLTDDATYEDFAEESVVSADGRRVAFHWGDKNPSIQVMNLDGTDRRVVLRDNHEHYLFAWSPDGMVLAVDREGPDRTHAIVLLSVEDGTTEPLITTGLRAPTIAGFSRDGRFLAYTLPKGAGDEPGGVYAVAVDGSHRAALVEGPAEFSSPLWSPDGTEVLFRSDRTGRTALWAVGVSDGQPTGQPRLLYDAEAGSLIGVAADGALFYGRRTAQEDAFLADFDPEALTLSAPKVVSDQVVGRNRAPEVSPDGRHMSFFRQAAAGREVIVRDLITGQERSVANLQGGGYGARGPLWFPDGRALLALDKPNRRTRIQRIDVDTGEAQVLFEGPYEIWTLIALSPDGRTLFYSIKVHDSSLPPEGLVRLIRREIDGGAETVLYQTASEGAGIFGLAVSQDGNQIAFQVNLGDTRALMVVSSQGGEARELMRQSIGDAIRAGGALTWTPDGRHLIVTGTSVSGRGEQLFALPVSGGPMRPLGREMSSISTRMLSADGRLLAFTATTEASVELWVVRNLIVPQSGR
jgi:Tol biopolymer transport system component